MATPSFAAMTAAPPEDLFRLHIDHIAQASVFQFGEFPQIRIQQRIEDCQDGKFPAQTCGNACRKGHGTRACLRTVCRDPNPLHL
jgi:hypothetical protein